MGLRKSDRTLIKEVFLVKSVSSFLIGDISWLGVIGCMKGAVEFLLGFEIK